MTGGIRMLSSQKSMPNPYKEGGSVRKLGVAGVWEPTFGPQSNGNGSDSAERESTACLNIRYRGVTSLNRKEVERRAKSPENPI